MGVIDFVLELYMLKKKPITCSEKGIFASFHVYFSNKNIKMM